LNKVITGKGLVLDKIKELVGVEKLHVQGKEAMMLPCFSYCKEEGSIQNDHLI
jgi:hypothetical protein